MISFYVRAHLTEPETQVVEVLEEGERIAVLYAHTNRRRRRISIRILSPKGVGAPVRQQGEPEAIDIPIGQ